MSDRNKLVSLGRALMNDVEGNVIASVSCFQTITEADPGFFLGGGAPLRNGVTDW